MIMKQDIKAIAGIDMSTLKCVDVSLAGNVVAKKAMKARGLMLKSVTPEVASHWFNKTISTEALNAAEAVI